MLVTQSCLTLCNTMGYSPPGSSGPWSCPSQNTGVGSHSLLQEIFRTQGLNLGFLHCRQVLYHLGHQRRVLHSRSLLFIYFLYQSVQFSCSVVSNSLRPHGLQPSRLPCPSPTPRFTQAHVHWVVDAIQPSHPLSSPSPPAFNIFSI